MIFRRFQVTYLASSLFYLVFTRLDVSKQTYFPGGLWQQTTDLIEDEGNNMKKHRGFH